MYSCNIHILSKKGVPDASWSALVSAAQSSSQKTCAWDFSKYLLDYN